MSVTMDAERRLNTYVDLNDFLFHFAIQQLPGQLQLLRRPLVQLFEGQLQWFNNLRRLLRIVARGASSVRERACALPRAAACVRPSRA